MKDQNEITDDDRDDADRPQSAGRRSLLKGTAIAMPAILTLQSGAALARSSNLISASRYPHTDRRGRTLCLDVDSVYPTRGSTHVYDMGEPAYARITAINERDHRILPRRDALHISEARACQEGRTVYYVDERNSWEGTWDSDHHWDDDDGGDSSISGDYVFRRRWNKVEVPQGVLVSATALTSFAGKYVVTDM